MTPCCSRLLCLRDGSARLLTKTPILQVVRRSKNKNRAFIRSRTSFIATSLIASSARVIGPSFGVLETMANVMLMRGVPKHIRSDLMISHSGGRFIHAAQDRRARGLLCVPNIRFSMDAENRRGKFAT
jgi:hypothetical protein